jgi:drug/metabolite transporter (DMT)-like permease
VHRCVKWLDVVGVVFAVVGIILITRPVFLLRLISPNFLPPMDIPDLAYGLALTMGIIPMTQPFLMATCSHIHWSSFILLRNFMGIILSAAYLTFSGGWVQRSDAPIMMYLTNIALGTFYNLARICKVNAVHEWDQVSPGFAGLMGNLIFTSRIPFMLFFGYIFYGEVITWIDGVGAAVIFISIISIAIVKVKLEIDAENW